MDFEGRFPCYTKRGQVKITSEKFEEFLTKNDQKSTKISEKRGVEDDKMIDAARQVKYHP